MLIGRSDPHRDIHPDIDLAPVDTKNSVSRIHAEIQRVTDGFSITDRGSMNGTFINGQRVKAGESRKLRANDRCRFGRVEFVFDGAKLRQV